MKDYLYWQNERNFFVLILIIGILFNFIAVSVNGNNMPIKYGEVGNEYIYPDNMHTFYQENDKVKLWMLTDWIDLYLCIISIGDVLITASVIMIALSQYKLLIIGR